jgi:hypothetical protein
MRIPCSKCGRLTDDLLLVEENGRSFLVCDEHNRPTPKPIERAFLPPDKLEVI